MNNNQIVPAANRDDESRQSSSKQAASGAADVDEQSRRSSEAALPNRDDTLRKLDRLPGLVVMKVLAPAQSNAINSVYQTILKELHYSEQGQSAQVIDESLLEILRVNPELLALIEPFLTAEQVKMVIREGQNDAPRDA